MKNLILLDISGKKIENFTKGGVGAYLEETSSVVTLDVLAREFAANEEFFCDQGSLGVDFPEISALLRSSATALKKFHVLESQEIKNNLNNLSNCSGGETFEMHKVSEILKDCTEPAFKIAENLFGDEDAAGVRFSLSSSVPFFSGDKDFITAVLGCLFSSGSCQRGVYIPNRGGDIPEIKRIGWERYRREKFINDHLINKILDFNQKLKKYERTKNY